MLEYNADTPTSLLEAAVIQWQWLEHQFPESDQLNSLHEALIERWKMIPEVRIHFACAWENAEDRQTIAYLAETAKEGFLALSASKWVEKPFFGREGGGVTLMDRGKPIARGAEVSQQGPMVYQKQANLFADGGNHFVWGLWMIGDECRGLSVRGDASPITGNLSRFFPHRIEG